MFYERDSKIEEIYSLLKQEKGSREVLQRGLDGLLTKYTRTPWVYRWFLRLLDAEEQTGLRNNLQKQEDAIDAKKRSLDYLIGTKPGTYEVETIDLIQDPEGDLPLLRLPENYQARVFSGLDSREFSKGKLRLEDLVKPLGNDNFVWR